MSCCTYLNWPFKKQNYGLHENDKKKETSPPDVPAKAHTNPITSQIGVNQPDKGQSTDSPESHFNRQTAAEHAATDKRNSQPNANDAETSRQTDHNKAMMVDQQQGSLEASLSLEKHGVTTPQRQGNEFLANTNEEYKGENSPGYSCVQTQAQVQLQRSLEASKQMLYGTFTNVIGILEEFEKREIAQSNCQPEMPNSHIPIPNQDHKNFDDIESIVQTQILLFETQMKYCPREVLGQVKEELIRLTICWTAVRAERGVKNINKTDAYVGKLLEVLVYGNTKHNVPESSGVSEQVLRDSFMAILQGVHSKNVLDDEFKNDRSRTATAPNIRGSSLIREGATRIAIARGLAQLDPALENIVSTLESANLK